jgi:hypothetical protein
MEFYRYREPTKKLVWTEFSTIGLTVWRLKKKKSTSKVENSSCHLKFVKLRERGICMYHSCSFHSLFLTYINLYDFLNLHTNIYIHTHKCIHSYIHTYTQADIYIYIHTDRQTLHTYIHKCMQTCIHTYLHKITTSNLFLSIKVGYLSPSWILSKSAFEACMLNSFVRPK